MVLDREVVVSYEPEACSKCFESSNSMEKRTVSWSRIDASIPSFHRRRRGRLSRRGEERERERDIRKGEI